MDMVGVMGDGGGNGAQLYTTTLPMDHSWSGLNLTSPVHIGSGTVGSGIFQAYFSMAFIIIITVNVALADTPSHGWPLLDEWL